MSNQKSKASQPPVKREAALPRQKMTREGKTILLVTAVACLLPMLLGAILYQEIPEIVPTGIVGREGKDDSLPRVMVAFGLPLLLCLLDVLANYQMNTDPKRIYGPAFIRGLCTWGFPVLSVVCCDVLILEAAGREAGLKVYTPLIVGMALLVLGGHFLRCKPGSLTALPLPWSRRNGQNFTATHRFAAWLWMATGLALLAVTSLTVTSDWITGVAVAVVLAAPVFYSWNLSRGEALRN